MYIVSYRNRKGEREKIRRVKNNENKKNNLVKGIYWIF
jgi:hypothetical protein